MIRIRAACLARASVQEVGGQFNYRYVVKPRTLDIVQTRSEHIYATGLHWTKWTGGYGVHGLFGGSATGAGTLHATGSGPHSITIYLWDVRNGGVNAFTYYEKLSIHGDSHVAERWNWSNHGSKWAARNRDAAKAVLGLNYHGTCRVKGFWQADGKRRNRP